MDVVEVEMLAQGDKFLRPHLAGEEFGVPFDP